jgi:hypothetical protein
VRRLPVFSRWQRLTLMANSTLQGPILLEDAIDLCDFLEATKRTIPRSSWAVESIAAAQRANFEAMI